MQKRVVLLITGRVQGVGYRYWAQKNAQELGLKGFVRNLNDGRVEAVLEGDSGDIEHFITKAKKGPAAAKVLNIDAEYGDVTGCFQAFDILKT